jgi:hypothetical protein
LVRGFVADEQHGAGGETAWRDGVCAAAPVRASPPGSVVIASPAGRSPPRVGVSHCREARGFRCGGHRAPARSVGIPRRDFLPDEGDPGNGGTMVDAAGGGVQDTGEVVPIGGR